jgi:hypothetical protein
MIYAAAAARDLVICSVLLAICVLIAELYPHIVNLFGG